MRRAKSDTSASEGKGRSLATETLIGIDIGTTAIKAILVDLDGNILQSFARSYPTARPCPGHVEQNPSDWMNGVLAALDAFLKGKGGDHVLGKGLTSQVNTHVFVDAGGTPLLPAMVWQDGRCGDDAARLDARIGLEQRTAWFGGPMPIDASHALSRIAYVGRVNPRVFAETRHVLLPKDYCALQLTGEAASDPISAVGLVDAKFAYIADLIAMVPGAREKLPPLRDFTYAVGKVRSSLPFAGVPVFIGTMDAWAVMFGIGVIRNGDAMYLSGTSEVPGILSARRVPTAGVIVFPSYKGITLHVAPTQSGGASLAWASALLGRSAEEISALVDASPRSTTVPLFLPHLQGERAPLWDIKSRGVFARLETATGPGEVGRSVMEGVAFSARLAFEAVETSADLVVDCLNLGGGGARSDVWCQIRADALGKALRRVRILDAGVVGAAAMAGLGSGAMPTLEATIGRMVSFERTFEPNRGAGDYYNTKFDKYRELYTALKHFNDGYG
jgi:xylulokinase